MFSNLKRSKNKSQLNGAFKRHVRYNDIKTLKTEIFFSKSVSPM